MSKIDVTLSAGQTVEYYEPGDFFRLLKASNPIKVEFYRNGAEISEAAGVTTGYAEKMRVGEFDRIRIYSATAQSVEFVTRNGADVYFDAPPTGDVTVQNVNGPFTHQSHTVTTTSSQLRPANPRRRYLLIQNNDASTSADIYVEMDGADATSTTGVKIPPGGSYELAGFVPTGAITAIGFNATNSSVLTVEG